MNKYYFWICNKTYLHIIYIKNEGKIGCSSLHIVTVHSFGNFHNAVQHAVEGLRVFFRSSTGVSAIDRYIDLAMPE